MVPFMFTVKNMNIEGKADGLTGEFLVPSYREFPGRLGVAKPTIYSLLATSLFCWLRGCTAQHTSWSAAGGGGACTWPPALHSVPAWSSCGA